MCIYGKIANYYFSSCNEKMTQNYFFPPQVISFFIFFNASYHQPDMTFPILPVISSPEDKQSIDEFSLVGQVLFPIESVSPKKHFIHQFPHDLDIFVNAIDNATTNQIVELLNVGIKQVFVNEKQYHDAIEAGLPSSRFVVAVDVPSTELLTSEASFVTSKPFSESDLKKYNANENRVIYIEFNLLRMEPLNWLKLRSSDSKHKIDCQT